MQDKSVEEWRKILQREIDENGIIYLQQCLFNVDGIILRISAETNVCLNSVRAIIVECSDRLLRE